MIKEYLQKINSNRMARDYLWVFGGQTFASLLHLVSMAIIIFVIGHEGNGVLLVVQAFSYLCGDIVNPQSFKAVVKFITEAKNKVERQNIITQGMWLDIFSGILGVAIAVLIMKPIAAWMKFDATLNVLLYLYLPCVFFRHTNSGSAIGVLRYLGKFNFTIIAYDVVSVVRILAYLILMSINCSTKEFIIVECTMEVLYAILLIVFAQIYSIKEGYHFLNFTKPKFNKTFISFNLYNMAASTADMSLGNLSSLIVSRYLGASLLSVFNTLGKISSIFSRFTTPLTQVVYPSFCKYVNELDFKRVKRFIVVYTVGIGFATVLMTIIGYTTFDLWRGIFGIGEEYLPETIIYIVFTMATCIGIPYHSAHTAFGLMKLNLINVCVIDVIYCLALIPIIKQFGLIGLITLLLIQSIVMIIVKWMQELKYMKAYSR